MSGTDWRRILVLASVVGFFEALLFSVLAPLLPAFEEGLGLSKASAEGFARQAKAGRGVSTTGVSER